MRALFNLFALLGALLAILAVAVAAYIAMVSAGWLNPWPALADVHANVLGAASALWMAAKSLATASWTALQGAGMSPPVQFAGVLLATSLLGWSGWWILRPRKPAAETAASAPAAAAASRTNVIEVVDITTAQPRWWWIFFRPYKGQKFYMEWRLAMVGKFCGETINSQFAADKAMHTLRNRLDVALRDISPYFNEVPSYLGRTPTHPKTLEMLMGLLKQVMETGQVTIEATPAPKAPAAKKVMKLGRGARIGAAFKLLWNGEVPKAPTTPRKRKVVDAAAPAPVAEVAPVVAPAAATASGAPAAAAEPAVATAAAPATAAAGAKVEVTVNIGATPAETVVVEDVPPAGPKPFVPDPNAPDAEVVEPAAAATTPPPADRSDKGGNGKRDGRDRRHVPDPADDNGRKGRSR